MKSSRTDPVKTIRIILLVGLDNLFEAISLPDSLTEPAIPFLSGIAPVAVVKIDVPLVFFHEVFHKVRSVYSGIGLDGVPFPQQKHSGRVREHDGVLGNLCYKFAGILMVIPCAPGLLTDLADKGQKIQKGENHHQNDQC